MNNVGFEHPQTIKLNSTNLIEGNKSLSLDTTTILPVKELFLPEFNEADKVRKYSYDKGLVDKNQRLINSKVKARSLNKYSQLLERIETALKKDRVISSSFPEEKPPRVTIDHKEYSILQKKMSKIKISFNLADLFQSLYDLELVEGRVESINIVGGYLFYLLGEQYCSDMLKAIYNENVSLHPDFLNELKRVPSDIDFQLDTITSSDKPIAPVILENVLGYFSSGIKNSFSTRDYLNYLKKTRSDRYKDINKNDKQKVKLLSIQETVLTKYCRFVDNGCNQLSMLGVTDEEGISFDIVIKGKKFDKKFLHSRDGVKIKLQFGSGGLTALLCSSSTDEEDIAQSFYDRHARIIYIPDFDKVDSGDLTKIVFISGTNQLIQPGAEERIFKRVLKEKSEFFNKQLKLGALNTKSGDIDYFRYLFEKGWKNHHREGDSSVPYLFRACRLLRLFSNITDSELLSLWDAFPKSIEEDPFYKLMQSALTDKKASFSELFSWMQALAFLFSQSSLTSWEGDTPIFCFKELLLPFEPSEAFKEVGKGLFKKITDKEGSGRVFMDLLSEVIIHGGSEVSFPSVLTPYLSHLESKMEGMESIAYEWVQCKDPTICYLGITLFLALPTAKMDEKTVRFLLTHFVKVFSLYPRMDLLDHIINRFEIALKYLKMSSPFKAFKDLLKKYPNKIPQSMPLMWTSSLFEVDDQFLTISYQIFEDYFKEELGVETKAIKVMGQKIISGFLKSGKKNTGEILTVLERVGLSSSIFIKSFTTLWFSLQEYEQKLYLKRCCGLVEKLYDLENKTDLLTTDKERKLFSSALHQLIQRLDSDEKQDLFLTGEMLVKISEGKFLLPLEQVTTWLEHLDFLIKRNDQKVSLIFSLYQQAYQNQFLDCLNNEKLKTRLRGIQKALVQSIFNSHGNFTLLLNELFTEKYDDIALEVVLRLERGSKVFTETFILAFDAFLLTKEVVGLFEKQPEKWRVLLITYLTCTLGRSSLNRPDLLKLLNAIGNWEEASSDSVEFVKRADLLFSYLIINKKLPKELQIFLKNFSEKIIDRATEINDTESLSALFSQLIAQDIHCLNANSAVFLLIKRLSIDAPESIVDHFASKNALSYLKRLFGNLKISHENRQLSLDCVEILIKQKCCPAATTILHALNSDFIKHAEKWLTILEESLPVDLDDCALEAVLKIFETKTEKGFLEDPSTFEKFLLAVVSSNNSLIKERAWGFLNTRNLFKSNSKEKAQCYIYALQALESIQHKVLVEYIEDPEKFYDLHWGFFNKALAYEGSRHLLSGVIPHLFEKPYLIENFLEIRSTLGAWGWKAFEGIEGDPVCDLISLVSEDKIAAKPYKDKVIYFLQLWFDKELDREACLKALDELVFFCVNQTTRTDPKCIEDHLSFCEDFLIALLELESILSKTNTLPEEKELEYRIFFNVSVITKNEKQVEKAYVALMKRMLDLSTFGSLNYAIELFEQSKTLTDLYLKDLFNSLIELTEKNKGYARELEPQIKGVPLVLKAYNSLLLFLEAADVTDEVEAVYKKCFQHSLHMLNYFICEPVDHITIQFETVYLQMAIVALGDYFLKTQSCSYKKYLENVKRLLLPLKQSITLHSDIGVSWYLLGLLTVAPKKSVPDQFVLRADIFLYFLSLLPKPNVINGVEKSVCLKDIIPYAMQLIDRAAGEGIILPESKETPNRYNQAKKIVAEWMKTAYQKK